MNLKPISAFSGAYLVSDDGRVFSAARVVAVRNHTQAEKRIASKELKTRIDTKGYVACSISQGGKTRHHRVHRLVLETFAPVDGSHLLDVNHKNGVKTDNRLENLEWATRGDNHIHRYRVLGQQHSMVGKFGEQHHRSIAVTGTAADGRQISFNALMDAQRAGYSAAKISQCLHGKRRTHAGMQWVISADQGALNVI